MIAPCKDCPENGCGKKHDTCEAYKAFRAEKDRAIEARQREHWVNDAIGEGIERVTKKKRSRA